MFKYTGAEEKGIVTVLIELLRVLKENQDNEGNQYRGFGKKKERKEANALLVRRASLRRA